MVHLPYINVLLGKLEQEGDTELCRTSMLM
jgi:hypothetical protein